MSSKRKSLRIPVRKHPGVFVLVDEDLWLEYLRLGFSENLTLAPNGSKHSYPKTMAWLPGPPSWGRLWRSTTIPLARTLVVIDARMSDLEGAEMLDTDSASEVLKISPRSLEDLRWRGGGPPYYKLGRRVRYLRRDLMTWALRSRRQSTGSDEMP